MIGVRLGRPHILRSVSPRAATASLPLLVALLLAGGQASAAESPPSKREGKAPVPSLAQAGADPFAAPADAAPGASGTPAAPSPGATPGGQAVPVTPAPATPAPAARDDRPGKPSLGPAPSPAATAEPRVLISEVVIEGLANHPESERLELATYAAMAVTPGNAITRS